jgi:hypothetical protein
MLREPRHIAGSVGTRHQPVIAAGDQRLAVERARGCKHRALVHLGLVRPRPARQPHRPVA